jgi:hypothetical protein
MHPSVPQAEIDAEMERDPAEARGEYYAEFRSDVEGFISRESVEACVSEGVHERAPFPGINYTAFVDPAGGGEGEKNDSFTLAIVHRQGDIVVHDCVREIRPPFSPEAAVAEFAALLKTYRIHTVRGDKFAGGWPPAEFQKCGVRYDQRVSPKSSIYHDVLPIINSRRCELLDHPRLINQLCGLVRRTGSSGRDIIDHPPRGHDDIANAVAGAIVHLATSRVPTADAYARAYGDGSQSGKSEEDRNAEWRRMQLMLHIRKYG